MVAEAALFLFVVMAVASKVSEFLSRIGANAGATMENIGMTAGRAVAGTPEGRVFNVDPSGVNTVGAVPPTHGMLGAVGMPGAAERVQAGLMNPQVARSIGAGVLGTAAAGAAAAGVVANRARKAHKVRKAGEHLGAQLGAGMPNVA